jgi:hypothetical protein
MVGSVWFIVFRNSVIARPVWQSDSPIAALVRTTRFHGTAKTAIDAFVRAVDIGEKVFVSRLQVVVADLNTPTPRLGLTVAHQFARDGDGMRLRRSVVGKFLTFTVRIGVTAGLYNKVKELHETSCRRMPELGGTRPVGRFETRP